ncbi:MAG: GNAT family N-acetyltransferase [Thermoanaerobaculia bacterium]|nr:GNAT family N-acetyltransferase [Thermoanaerobaculia bacterium]
MDSVEIRRLAPDQVDAYRSLMLEAYADAPEAFTATVAEREPVPTEFWRARLAEGDSEERVYGAIKGHELVGVAGLRFRNRPKTRHKAWLFGMYVRSEHRSVGLGRALVNAVLDGARSRDGVLLVQLTVSETNDAAIRLYRSCGFQAFGTEPMAIRVEDRFLAKVHMWRPLDRS